MKKLSGSCMCGSVQYELTGKCREIIACHCTQCRKTSGHFTAATSTIPDDLKMIKEAGLKWYRCSPSAQRGFCKNCGSTLFWKPDSGDRISVFVGTIDGPTNLTMSAHIYVEEQGDYYDIDANAEQYAKGGANLSV